MRSRLVLALALAACEGRIGAPASPPPPTTTATPAPTSSPSPSASPPPLAEPTPLDSGIRRLTRAEILAQLEALLPGAQLSASALPEDTRQSDFTRNRAQIVDPIFAGALETVAREAARDAVEHRFSALVPCASGDNVGEPCATDTIRALAARGFRGPVDAETLDALKGVYAVGLAEGDARLGMRLVLEAIVQAPSFVYARELGDAPFAGRVRLDGRELAESLAQLVTGQPPDEALLAAGASGELDLPAGRASALRRLYATPAARRQLGRVIAEWLRVDRLGETAKDATAYPDFFALRPAMEAEATELFERAVAAEDTLGVLLTSTEGARSPALAAMYGAAPRPGVLSRAAFLSVYASPTETSPVRRGNAILSRLLCVELPLPVNLMIQIVPPAPDPALTTRERYAQHSRDPACASCHAQIDPLGFAFEGYDGMGRARTVENGRPIDARATVTVGSLAGSFADADALIARLATARQTRACFARKILRYAAGTHAPAFEDRLVERWSAGSGRGLLDVLLLYVESDAFATRTAP